MWEAGRAAVESTFFRDTIHLYAVATTMNVLNEEVEQLVSVGQYKCNIENGQSSVSRNEAGSGSPQMLRISLPKGTPLDYRLTYVVKIVDARVLYDASDSWRVDGWTEAMLSTVVTASRSVSV